MATRTSPTGLAPMSRYWVSWWEPEVAKRVEVEQILGEWQCGIRERRYANRRNPADEFSMVALISAESDHHAQFLIEANRTVIEWRFRNLVVDDWTPGDRFPMEAP